VIEVETNAVPLVRYDVRRRRYGTVTWLIRKNDWFQIDRTTDIVWLACEDETSIDRIAARVADDLKIDLGEALAATILTVSRLQFHGLVEDVFDLPAEVSPSSRSMQRLQSE
jgi:hypothetical protein